LSIQHQMPYIFSFVPKENREKKGEEKEKG
jgi:hypothetical protein